MGVWPIAWVRSATAPCISGLLMNSSRRADPDGPVCGCRRRRLTRSAGCTSASPRPAAVRDSAGGSALDLQTPSLATPLPSLVLALGRPVTVAEVPADVEPHEEPPAPLVE